jgi:hypothetical protein
VAVQPGGAAWILVAKYRCDLGELRDATTIELTLPGAVSVLADPPPLDGGVSALPYCRGGDDNPGETVTVSPMERDPASSPAVTMPAGRRIRSRIVPPVSGQCR